MSVHETSSPAEHKDIVPTGEAGVGFTPGPWEVDGEYDFWVYGNSGQNSVCKIDSARQEADLALILAAPELYEALEDLARWSSECVNLLEHEGYRTTSIGLDTRVRVAMAALKQARGVS